MSWPYLHLIINHFPIALGVLGTVAVVLSWITNRRTVWVYALATLTLAGLTAWPVHFTGKQADHLMTYQWYVSRDAIHQHEEAGDVAMWALLATGAIAAFGWWLLARRGSGGTTEISARRGTGAALPFWVRGFVTLGAIFATAATGWTSHLGGNIVYQSPAFRGQGIGFENKLAVRPANAPRGAVAPMPPLTDSAARDSSRR